MEEDYLEISIDGSSLPSPRKGGIGCYFIFPEKCGKMKSRSFSPVGFFGATNNQMELKACIFALQKTKRLIKENQCIKGVLLCSDSQYFVQNYSKAIWEWPKNKWRYFSGAPVRNTILWKEFRLIYSGLRNMNIMIKIKKVKGHSSNQGNNEADKLAKKSAKKASKNNVIIPTRLRRKKSPNSVSLGSVRMNNQDILIRIITSLEVVNNEHRYKYEVIDKTSEYFQNVDEIWSKKVLKVGHIYLVTVNSKQNYPQVVNIKKEIIE